MATLPSLTQKTPALTSLLYGAQSPFGSGDDAKFTMSDVKDFITSSNIVTVKSESDLPAPVAGVITLESKEYVFDGLVVISNTLKPPKDGVCTITGVNLFSSGIFYTGTGTLFENLDFGAGIIAVTRCLVLAPTGKLFDITGTSAGFVVSESVIYNNVDQLGQVTNCGCTFFFSSIFNWGQGFTANSTAGITFSRLNYAFGKNQVSAVMLSINGAQLTIQVTSNFFITAGANETILDIDVASTNTGAIALGSSYDISSGGAVFAAGSKDQTNIDWFFSSNPGIKNSISFGNMNIGTPVTVTIASIGVPVIVNDTNTGGTNIWTNIGSERFTVDTSLGRLTYNGNEDVVVSVFVTSTIEKVGGGSDQIATLIVKNGTVLSESKSITQNSTPTGVTSIAEVSMSTNDYLELAVLNDGSLSNIILNVSNYIVNS
jgi:hypothetical protein